MEVQGTLRWLVLGFVLLFALWYLGGGPERVEKNTSPVIPPPYQQN